MCPIGAQAMYLYYRFECTGEMENDSINWTDNNTWFKRKLLVQSTVTMEDLEEPMSIRTYADAMKAILLLLGMGAAWQAHFGRKVGPILMEFMEVPKGVIDSMGNWLQTQQEESYSAWLPLLGLRVLAGFTKERSSVYCKRGTKPPSAAGDTLKPKVFPWLAAAQAQCETARQGGRDCFTAILFLRMLSNLAEVLLQDIAVLMDESNRVDHPLFNMPLFQSNDFSLYRQEMRQHLATAPDPVDTSMEACLPGVTARFDSLNESLADINSAQSSLQNEVKAGFGTTSRRLDRLGNGMFSAGLGLCTAVSTHEDGTGGARSVLPFASKNASAVANFIHRVALANPSSGISVPDAGSLAQILERADDRIFATASDVESPGNRQTNAVETSVSIFDINNIELSANYSSVTELYNEWHGLDHKQDQPVPGGFEALEIQRGSQWRKGYDTKANQRFSKLKRIVESIKRRQGCRETPDISSVLSEYDGWWRQCNRSPSNMIDKLQKEGYIVVTKRSKRPREQITENT